MMITIYRSITAFYLPFLNICNKANAWPAVLVDGADVLEALKVDWDILSLLLGGLVANWIGYVMTMLYLC